jgi:hypothetical protein
MRKQLSGNLSAHNATMKAVEDTANEEVDSLKRSFVEQAELLHAQERKAEGIQKKHELATVTMRVELEVD